MQLATKGNTWNITVSRTITGKNSGVVWELFFYHNIDVHIFDDAVVEWRGVPQCLRHIELWIKIKISEQWTETEIAHIARRSRDRGCRGPRSRGWHYGRGHGGGEGSRLLHICNVSDCWAACHRCCLNCIGRGHGCRKWLLKNRLCWLVGRG